MYISHLSGLHCAHAPIASCPIQCCQTDSLSDAFSAVIGWTTTSTGHMGLKQRCGPKGPPNLLAWPIGRRKLVWGPICLLETPKSGKLAQQQGIRNVAKLPICLSYGKLLYILVRPFGLQTVMFMWVYNKTEPLLAHQYGNIEITNI